MAGGHYKPRKTYSFKTEQRRRATVSALRDEYNHFKATLLNKDPMTLTREEQLQISEFRIRIQIRISSLKRHDAPPYMDELLGELNAMEDGLIKWYDCIDRETFNARKKQRNKESVQRYQTRKKAAEYGVIVNAPERSPLKDSPPPLIAMKRRRNTASARRAKARKLGGMNKEDDRPQDLLSHGWGLKRNRA